MASLRCPISDRLGRSDQMTPDWHEGALHECESGEREEVELINESMNPGALN